MCSNVHLADLACQLFEIGAVKFGSYKLKSGVLSPVYFDLRIIVSHPRVLVKVAEVLDEISKNASAKYKSICGVPYTALPIATLISAQNNVPMLVRRKEMKDYGTKKLIEGEFEENDVCLVVEDVVTTGSSVLETAQALKGVGVLVHDAVVLLDREQGGKDNLLKSGIHLHSVFKVTELMTILEQAGKVDKETVAKVQAFIGGNQVKLDQSAAVPEVKILDHLTRASLASHPTSRKIFELMHKKKTNLCLSADVCSSQKLLELADTVGPFICVLKTHVDILDDFTDEVAQRLVTLSQQHEFVIFEDRKFADLGHTVSRQFGGGVYKISQWADLINAHILPGPGIIKGLREANIKSGCLLIAEMSSEKNLLTAEYTKAAVKMAEENKDFVMGFICQSRLSDDPGVIHFTPGVHLKSKGDDKGQQYLTPSKLVEEKKVDVLIVGRGIVESQDPVGTARLYAQEGYKGYLSVTNQLDC